MEPEELLEEEKSIIEEPAQEPAPAALEETVEAIPVEEPEAAQTEETIPVEKPSDSGPLPAVKPAVLGRILVAAVIFLLGVVCGYQLRGMILPSPVEESGETETIQGEPLEPEETTVQTLPTGPSVETDWWLRLVNPWTFLEDDFTVELAALPNGLQVDQRCYEDLMQMLGDCRAAGLRPVVCSAYRSVEQQNQLFENKVSTLMSAGASQEEAEREAAAMVAVPGTSEHHLGLAVDIVDETYQLLDEAQEETGVQKWLLEHCWEYGFILRYPNDKSHITGIIYEPWHYRYVGRETAQEIFQRGLTLEEYLALPEETRR